MPTCHDRQQELSFISLNVHGSLTEKLKSEDFVTSVFKFDVILLCETWSNKLSDLDVDGYVRISKTRKLKKRAKRSSGGIEVYIKEHLIKGIKVLDWDFEDGLNFHFEKDFFGWDRSLFLFFTYFKPKNSSRADLDNDKDCFTILMDQIAKLPEEGAVLIAGDLNSRVSTMQECNIDYMNNNDNIFNELSPLSIYEHAFTRSDFYENDMSVTRVNKDCVINDYGYKLIDLCTTCDFAILNGRAGSDRGQGQTTFCGPKGESCVDYVLCDKYVLKNITHFGISDHVSFSDHKMLYFKLKSFINISKEKNQSINDLPCFYTKWNETKRDDYIKNLESQNVINEVNELSKILVNIDCKEKLDHVISSFSNIVNEAGLDHVRKFKLDNNYKKGKY